MGVGGDRIGVGDRVGVVGEGCAGAGVDLGEAFEGGAGAGVVGGGAQGAFEGAAGVVGAAVPALGAGEQEQGFEVGGGAAEHPFEFGDAGPELAEAEAGFAEEEVGFEVVGVVVQAGSEHVVGAGVVAGVEQVAAEVDEAEGSGVGGAFARERLDPGLGGRGGDVAGGQAVLGGRGWRRSMSGRLARTGGGRTSREGVWWQGRGWVEWGSGGVSAGR